MTTTADPMHTADLALSRAQEAAAAAAKLIYRIDVSISQTFVPKYQSQAGALLALADSYSRIAQTALQMASTRTADPARSDLTDVNDVSLIAPVQPLR